MKLRNKKTGEVFNFVIKAETDPTESHFKLRTGSGGWEDGLVYGSLEELNEEWEDYYEGPKKYWLISPVDADVEQTEMEGDEVDTFNKQIGNYFETKEEAEKAVEKLKAWKRLKDKGFRFIGIAGLSDNIYFEVNDKYRGAHIEYDKYSNTDDKLEEYNEDLELLFGGEE